MTTPPDKSFFSDLSARDALAILVLICGLAGTWATSLVSIRENTRRIAAIETSRTEQQDLLATSQIELVRQLTELQTEVRYLRNAVEDLAGTRRGARD